MSRSLVQTEAQAKHAAYMRTYNEDPEHREKKRTRERRFAREHAKEKRQVALAHYYANQEGRQRRIKQRECHLKRQAVEYLGGACACGETHPGLLQFHHRDPSQKLFNITCKLLSCVKLYPDAVVKAELDKCDLVCANCHFLEHNTWIDEWLKGPIETARSYH